MPVAVNVSALQFSRPGFADGVAEILASSDAAEQLYVEKILPRKVALYTAYVQNAGFRSDLQIIARTLGAAFSRRRPGWW